MEPSPRLSSLVTTVTGLPSSFPQVYFVLYLLPCCTGGREHCYSPSGTIILEVGNIHTDSALWILISLTKLCSVSMSSGLLVMREPHGTQSRPSPSSKNQDSGTQQNRFATSTGQSLGTSPGMMPLSAKSPIPSTPAKSSCSSHSSGGPTTKSMGTCRPFRLLLF